MATEGIDPHKHVRIAVAVRGDGRPIGKPLPVKNDALLIITLLKWIRSITDGTATWAVEDGRGFARRLGDGLLLAGQEAVWVPARLTAAHRKLHAATGAKSDPVDSTAYPKGVKIPDREVKDLEKQQVLQRQQFHGEWNYSLTRGLP
jgi:transposase